MGVGCRSNLPFFVLTPVAISSMERNGNDILTNEVITKIFFTTNDLFNIIANPVQFLFEDLTFPNSTLFNLFDEHTIDTIISEIEVDNNFDFEDILNKSKLDRGMIEYITESYSFLLYLLDSEGSGDFDFVDSIGQIGTAIGEETIRNSHVYKVQSPVQGNIIVRPPTDINANSDDDESADDEFYDLDVIPMNVVSDKSDFGKHISGNIFSTLMLKGCESCIRNWYLENLMEYKNYLRRYVIDERTGLINNVRDSVSNGNIIYNYVADLILARLVSGIEGREALSKKELRIALKPFFDDKVGAPDIINDINRILASDLDDLAVEFESFGDLKKEYENVNYDEIWYAIVATYFKCLNNLEPNQSNQVSLSYINNTEERVVICKYSNPRAKTICGYGLEFTSSKTGCLYDVADVYPAQKVILCLMHLCQYSEILNETEVERLKDGMAAYMIYVNLFNSTCACHMELSWNRGIGNSYVYNKILYGENYNKRTDFSMLYSSKWKEKDEILLTEFLGYYDNNIDIIKEVDRMIPENEDFDYPAFIETFKERDSDLYNLLFVLQPIRPKEIIYHWKYVLYPVIKTDKWTPEEDDIIKKFVWKNGTEIFHTLSRLDILNGKTLRQIRDRWFNYLSPKCNKREWSPEDDVLLINLFERYGNEWNIISKSFIGRSGNSCKNRYKEISKKGLPEKQKQQTPIPQPALPQISSTANGSFAMLDQLPSDQEHMVEAEHALQEVIGDSLKNVEEQVKTLREYLQQAEHILEGLQRLPNQSQEVLQRAQMHVESIRQSLCNAQSMEQLLNEVQ